MFCLVATQAARMVWNSSMMQKLKIGDKVYIYIYASGSYVSLLKTI